MRQYLCTFRLDKITLNTVQRAYTLYIKQTERPLLYEQFKGFKKLF